MTDNRFDFIANYMDRKSLKDADQVYKAYNYLNSKNIPTKKKEELLKIAYIMCRYLRPDADDLVVAILIRMDIYVGTGKSLSREVKKVFGEEYGTKYLTMLNKIDNHNLVSGAARYDRSNYLLMMSVCDKMYKELIQIMKNEPGTTESSPNKVPGEEIVKAAYDYARKVHADATRQSGEPYIAHPLNVARILAKLQVECDVIAAALLHDVVEDGKMPEKGPRPATKYFLDEIERVCNRRVRKLVNAVTSRHRELSESDNQDEYSKDKAEMDKASVEKLRDYVERDEDMIPALYIKAADRIHNLATMDVMSSQKQRNKVDETEKEYLPLFNDYGLTYFCERIRDFIYKINHPELYMELESTYKEMVTGGPDVLQTLKKKLSTAIDTRLNAFRDEEYSTDEDDHPGKLVANVYKRRIRPRELSVMLNKEFKVENINAEMIDKKVIPIGRLDIIIDDIQLRETEDNATLDLFMGPWIKYFVNSNEFAEYAIIDIVRSNRDKMLITLEDDRRNMYRLNFMTRSYYMNYLFGSDKGFYKELEYTEEEESGEITVFLKDGKTRTLPAGSTVIDCAFEIHTDIGLCLRSATIDGKQVSIDNRLYSGAKVVVEHGAKRKDGILTEFHPTARLSWLFAVKTDNAKKRLIDYFSRKYGEGDNPLYEFVCHDDTVEKSARKMIEALKEE